MSCKIQQHALLFAAVVMSCMVPFALAHGSQSNPKSRNVLNPINGETWWKDHGNGVGTATTGPKPADGPGVCGDPFQHSSDSSYYSHMANQPIQATYTAGQTITLSWDITVNHGGRIGFKLCSRATDLTQDCFNQYPLFRADIPTERYTYIMGGSAMGLLGTMTAQYKLPEGVTCPGGCVLQWEYLTMNSCFEDCNRAVCGVYADKQNPVTGQYNMPTCCLGAGCAAGTVPEVFRNCVDVAITSGTAPISSPTPATPSPSPAVASPSPPPPAPTASPSSSVPVTDNCPTAPGAARASCFCKTVTVYKYYADTGNGCTGAMWCYGPGQSTYVTCQSGLLFNEKQQACDWPANVQCAAAPASSPLPATPSPSPAVSVPSPSPRPAASPSPAVVAASPSPRPVTVPSPSPAVGPSCSAGYTSGGGACGAANGGKCCPSGQCCSQYGYCGTSTAHCGTGCQSLYGSCTGSTTPSPSPAVVNPTPSPSPAGPKPSPSPRPPATGGSVGDFITEATFEEIFKHRNDVACASKGFYTYAAFLAAADAFPGFGTSADAATNKREIAAFLAQISHETTGGWPTAPDGPYSWGLCWIVEGGVTPPVAPYCAATAEYPCADGKKYYGRGPMQLSWNYNYIPAGEVLGFDGLNNPDIVAEDPVIAFKTAVWFWMTPRDPKPSCHDVMTGAWTPTAADVAANRLPGFGMTTNIVNGGLECNSGSPDSRVADRIGYFKRYAGLMGVTYGDNLDCYNMQHY